MEQQPVRTPIEDNPGEVVETPGALASTSRITDTTEDETIAKKKRLWLFELWEENRESFKALMEHAFIFVLLIAILVFFHLLFKVIPLEEHRKEILDTIDFWGIVIAVVIFGISFLVKLLVRVFGRGKNGTDQQ